MTSVMPDECIFVFVSTEPIVKKEKNKCKSSIESCVTATTANSYDSEINRFGWTHTRPLLVRYGDVRGDVDCSGDECMALSS